MDASKLKRSYPPFPAGFAIGLLAGPVIRYGSDFDWIVVAGITAAVALVFGGLAEIGHLRPKSRPMFEAASWASLILPIALLPVAYDLLQHDELSYKAGHALARRAMGYCRLESIAILTGVFSLLGLRYAREPYSIAFKSISGIGLACLGVFLFGGAAFSGTFLR